MNGYDKIFWPDRSPAEVARFRREGKKFFETAVRRPPVDHIFYPDRSASEVARFRREGQAFFETAVRRKSTR